jgi:DNA-directed RNA polymerase subunit RPC12/RpoP
MKIILATTENVISREILNYLFNSGGEITTTKSAAVGAIDVTSIKAAQGEGCPRCGGKVFMAEEINARGRVRLLHLAENILRAYAYI